MLQQGCRPEELRVLEKDDVDLEGGTLTVREGKATRRNER
jgi:integrase